MSDKHYYRYHLFFCTHQRDSAACCADQDSQSLRDYSKKRIKSLGLDGVGGIRINNAGCLGRCAEGPVLVVYPDEVWYSYQNRVDVDEIIESHLQNNIPVDRLKV